MKPIKMLVSKKPFTHRAVFEYVTPYKAGEPDGYILKVTQKCRLTPKMVITMAGESFRKNGAWKKSKARALPSVGRVVPETLKPIPVEELRRPLEQRVDIANQAFKAAEQDLKQAERARNKSLDYYTKAKNDLIAFDKAHRKGVK